jgi:putative redox protein
MAFEANVNDHKIILDADESVGGQNLGPRPKPMILAGLGGCTGMDVVALLKKMKVNVDAFEIRIHADLTEEHPRIYQTIIVYYVFWGKDLPMDKLEKAVSLSQEKYCGVSAMLGKSSKISYKIVIEE